MKQDKRLQIATALDFKIEIIKYRDFRHLTFVLLSSSSLCHYIIDNSRLYIETLMILRSNIHMITFKSQKSNVYLNNWQLIFDCIFLLQLQLQHCFNFYCNIYTKIFLTCILH